MSIDSVILAGGQSTRMGKPKALLEINNSPLITHLVRKVKSDADKVFIAASFNEELIRNNVPDNDVIFIKDYYSTNEGPLSGIASALLSSTADYLWVNSVDSFGSTYEIKNKMLKTLEIEKIDIIFLKINDRYHPLQAIMRTSQRDKLLRYLNTGKRSVLGWYLSENYSVINLPDNEEFWPNINTPDDFEKLKSSFKR